MFEMGPASNDDMVLAFLRAEIDSPVWGPHYMQVVGSLRFERSSLIDKADLNDLYANSVRGTILGADSDGEEDLTPRKNSLLCVQ